MGRRGKRFKKKKFKWHKLVIIICLALITVSLYFIFKYKDKLNFKNIFGGSNKSSINDKNNTVDGVEIVPNDNKENKEISEEDAKNIAIRQFANLGEGANPNKLNVIRLQRNGEEFFYVSSPKNTVEIRISDGKITKINSVVVEE